MTRQQAGVSAEALAQHWLSEMVCDHNMKRDRAICCCGFVTIWKPTVGDAAKAWAEHALLATAPPEQDQANRVEVCGMCGGFLEGNYCPACDATVDEDARDAAPQPQAASGGALSAEEIEQLVRKETVNLESRNARNEPCIIPFVQWDRVAAALAAHDQKVLAETLELAAKAAAWTPKDTGIIVGKEWYTGYEAGCRDAETRVRALAAPAASKPEAGKR